MKHSTMAVKTESTDEDNLDETEYQELFAEKKKELLLENRRRRVTDMSFDAWFFKTYSREFKASDRAIKEAYYGGAFDEIDNNEWILEEAGLKAGHYRVRLEHLADDLQMLYSLLENITRKSDPPDKLRSLVKKTLANIHPK